MGNIQSGKSGGSGNGIHFRVIWLGLSHHFWPLKKHYDYAHKAQNAIGSHTREQGFHYMLLVVGVPVASEV